MLMVRACAIFQMVSSQPTWMMLMLVRHVLSCFKIIASLHNIGNQYDRDEISSERCLSFTSSTNKVRVCIQQRDT